MWAKKLSKGDFLVILIMTPASLVTHTILLSIYGFDEIADLQFALHCFANLETFLSSQVRGQVSLCVFLYR